MDPRDVRHQQQQPPPHLLQSPPMLMNPASYLHSNTIPNSGAISHSSSARFPFGSLPPPHMQPPHHQQPQPQPSTMVFNGSQPQLPMRFLEPTKKKRGRPRKYPDAGNSSGLASAHLSPATNAELYGTEASPAAISGGGGGAAAAESSVKRQRGRPPGSGKKQQHDPMAGIANIRELTAHLLFAQPGEDILAKIMAFSLEAPRTFCVLSAVGTISRASVCPTSSSDAVRTYEGHYDIILLKGFYSNSEENGSLSRTRQFTIQLAGSDGQIVVCGIPKMLIAGSQVQMVLGSFSIKEKKQKPSNSFMNCSPSTPLAANMMNLGAAVPVTGASPPSQHTSSVSSDDDDSPPQPVPEVYGNSNSQGLQDMQMYHQLWNGQTRH